jgi:hypothetical protein
MRSNKKKSMRARTNRRKTIRTKPTRSNKKAMSGGHRRNKRYTKKHHKRNPKHIHSDYMMHGGGSPPPWIGSPYYASDSKPSGNFLPLSDEGIPSGLSVPPENSNPQFGGRSMRMRSGKKYNKGNRQRGGGLSEFITAIVPEDLLNIGRSIPAAAGNLMDRFNGSISSASSQVYPTQQPLVPQSQQNNMTVNPPDINAAYERAVSAVRR